MPQPVAREMLTGRAPWPPGGPRSRASARSLLFLRVTPFATLREKGRAHEGQRSHVFHAPAAALAHGRGPHRALPARAPLLQRAESVIFAGDSVRHAQGEGSSP